MIGGFVVERHGALTRVSFDDYSMVASSAMKPRLQ